MQGGKVVRTFHCADSKLAVFLFGTFSVNEHDHGTDRIDALCVGNIIAFDSAGIGGETENAGKVLTKSIPQELADKLATSAKTILKNASVPYTKTDNGENSDDVIWVEIYDGFYAYALIPDKIAECQTGEFTDIPDKAWMDEVIKFKEFKEDSKEDDADILVCIDGNGAEGEPIDILQDQDGVYLVVPEMPEYPGGAAALLSSFREALVYPEDAKAEGIQGRVLVQFIVEEDGSITNPVIIKSVYPSLDAEALRFVAKMPKWKPGKIDDKPCRTKYIVPLNFRLN